MKVDLHPTPRELRRFAEVFPPIKERCLRYMAASKWYNLEKLEPNLVKLWIQQMSLWTRSAFKLRGHVYANCPHPELRIKLLEVVREEDVVDPRVGMNHRQLLVSSLGRASGQALADLEKVRPLPTTLVTFDILYGIANRSWEEGIALASGNERVLQESGYFRFEANRLKRDLGWSSDDVAWFTGHDVADEEHGSVIELLDNYIDDDRTWDRVGEAIVESLIAWWLLFDGVVDAYRQRIEPVEGISCKGLSRFF
jgi:pyrroloquinoline quinone (PQQ) biosynthesis protein C